ncbi:MAG: hypothetical protein U9N49_13125, partial [Campylobacterota bacterium]|nr:hypothetical protein [Campylobacterota bacterium]
KVLSFQMLMDSFFDQVAKRLHTHYGKIYEPNRIYNDINEIERRWYQSKPSDRGSTLAQAYHIPIKLEALGLKLQKVESQTEQALLMHNKKIINEVIGEELIEMGLDDNTLSKVTQKKFEQWKTLQEPFEYFPIKFELLIERLIRCEKNRWNAHHYLNGWRYNSNKNKALKQHDCLLPFEDMLPHTKFTVLYDIYTIVYLPNILATIGYQIIKENS